MSIRGNKLKTAVLSAFLAITFQQQAFSQEINTNLHSLPGYTSFDLEGHRGARGLFPENTVPAFLAAVDLGVTTLEMDIVVTKDKKLLVSHDTYLSGDICSLPDGKPVRKQDEKKYNIYQMDYSLVSGFDCGKRGNRRFPRQSAMNISKPLLSQVVKEVEAHLADKGLPLVQYNIETKSLPGGDNKNHPAPAEFVRLLYGQLKGLNILDRVIIQSFDNRTLQEMRKTDPNVRLSLLADNSAGLSENIKHLGFEPAIYSPDFHQVSPGMVSEAHKRGIQVIPWTVNKIDDMKKVKEMGVDGFITDYPDTAYNFLTNTK
jgi:glycerophosphoryl diester phosphodiesterase